MNVNSIDEFIDTSLDDFYTSYVLSKNSYFKDIVKNPNFVKYQLKITNSITEYIDGIKKDKIKKIVNSDANVTMIIDIIKRYLAYYIFLTIGFFYNWEQQTYLNNINEITINHSSSNFKINNFFNSENNAILIKFFKLIKNIQYIFSIKDIKKSVLATSKGKILYKDSILFLNNLGEDFVNATLKTGPDEQKAHNLIKIIVFKILYQEQEKIEVFKIIEDVEHEKSNFKFIEIVESRKNVVDYFSIKQILSATTYDTRNRANFIYESIIEQNKEVGEITSDYKITQLLKHKILIPITEDFMRYHKDTERYDVDTKKSYAEIPTKRKENTKLKYIINKMDIASNLYSKDAKNTPKDVLEKVFYPPLSERRAVLFNDMEEIKIINKIQSQSRYISENVDFYEDLLNYGQYVYLNFRNFNRLGFELTMDETVDAARSVSFDFFSKDKNVGLQTRVVGGGLPAHIVGFIIANIDNNPLQCVKMSKIKDIRIIGEMLKKNGKLNEKDEGIEIMSYILKHTVFKMNTNYPPMYWLFDKRDLTTLNNYELVETSDESNSIKKVASILYDNCNKYSYNFIKKRIHNMKIYSTEGARNILDNVQNILMPIEKKLIGKLEKTVVFSNKLKKQESHDVREDTYPGFEFDLIKRSVVQQVDDSDKIETVKVAPKVVATAIEEKRQSYEKIYNTAVEDIQELVELKSNAEIATCQHVLTWQEIMIHRKKNALMFEKKMHEFMQQYVTQNSETEYVCKSCGIVLYINNYVADGFYDDAEGKFRTLGIIIDVPLEEIPEYKKIDKTIKTIDRILEKIASISNIAFYIGNVNIVKWRRKIINKNVVDILFNHNRNLRKVYDERKQTIEKKYGIQKNLSNLFYFDVDNNIFTTSSASTDFYKLVKANNVVAYVVILLILDLNEGLLLNLTRDKTGKIDKICNINNYFKYKDSLFNNIKIIFDKAGDVADLINYPVLTFLIYYFSCVITKHKMWYMGQNASPESMQKIIICTIVDALNSILELSTLSKHIIYSIVSNKYFLKLNDLYKNNNIIEEIKAFSVEEKKTGKEVRVPTKRPEIPTIEMPGVYTDPVYKDKFLTNYIIPLLKFIKIDEELKIDHISHITNCLSGTFHEWFTDGKNLKCKKCGLSGEIFDNKDDKKVNEELENKSINLLLTKLSNKKCVDNRVHLFANRVCKFCGKKENDVYTQAELLELAKNIDKDQEKNIIRQFNHGELVYDAFNRMNKIQTGIVNNVKKLYESINYDVSLYFINSIEKIRKNISTNLMHNNYIIDHDYYGNLLKTSITISDADTKIMFKENHPFFKTNVIYYTNKQAGYIDLFYDASSNVYLGYKESNKNYVLVKNNFRYLKINYSIKSKLIYLGFTTFFIKNKDKDAKKIIEDHLIRRLDNLKKTIIYIQRILYNIKYTKEQKKEQNIFMSKFVDVIEDPIKQFVEKYRKDLHNINTENVLSDWKKYYESVFYQNKYSDMNIDTKSNYIDVKELSKEDIAGNYILCYIVTELLKLISVNGSEKIIIEFVFDLISMLFEFFNTDKYKSNYEIKRFIYILHAKTYIVDTEKKGLGLQGFYEEDMTEEEMKQSKEAVEDAEEAENALDIDRDIDERGEEEEALRDFDDIGDREHQEFD